jgi:hypothetical protein
MQPDMHKQLSLTRAALSNGLTVMPVARGDGRCFTSSNDEKAVFSLCKQRF